MATTFTARLALAKISEDILMSPSTRQEFLADPNGFVAQKYGVADTKELQAQIINLKDMIADGTCCHGCGCSPLDSIDRIGNPVFRR